MYICGEPSIHLPMAECDACDELLERIMALEEMLGGKEDIVISKTDTDSEITVTVLGKVENNG